ncbi:hypothetical protein H0262_04335 [Psychrobacter cryohalolentis]|uniref:hypothetical protein n=1 Tax=Psychrobacter sp. D2 TaxID=2759702 RepID=UPI0015E5E4EE|nr:hypothetical protein [Psychrobacter sp. D2]MBA2057113.1 hypothetical protein [Psychrobacter sp. D2]
MTTISPTRVSMYDFLYQDTKPLVSLLADAAALSLPQARLAMTASLQAIISALLAYQQRHQGQALSKKLFGRSAVKEMRQYNSMNFATLNTTLYHRHDAADAIFHDNARVSKASEYIAAQIDATAPQVQILLTTLCVIVLRELAILVEYSQLDHDEVNKWFALQPQFLSKARFAIPVSNLALNESADDSDEAQTTLSAVEAVKIESVASDEHYLLIAEQLTDNPPAFDPYWYELTAFIAEQFEPVKDTQLATGNYLKAIGRSAENIQQGKHNDLLMFAPMTAIGLPHQRWLVQLAKISEIYLQRNRLRITSEPINPPKPPLVSSGLLSSNSNNDNTPSTLSEKPIEYEASVPLWKNPVILLIILVIGGLGILATIKYETQKSNGVILATEEVLEERQQQDVAIVMVNEDTTADDKKSKAE